MLSIPFLYFRMLLLFVTTALRSQLSSARHAGSRNSKSFGEPVPYTAYRSLLQNRFPMPAYKTLRLGSTCLY